jgi:hypothetical protein
MKLEELFLKKEEHPILHCNCFQIPILPMLLDEKITISKALPRLIFLKVAQEWYEELKELVESENDEERKWIEEVFLKTPPGVIERFGYQRIEHLSWEDSVSYEENGFVRVFSISRDSGGTMYFNKGETECEDIIPNRMMKFSEEKARKFESRRVGEQSLAFVYSLHNVDALPGALFLRNWAIGYMNEVFTQVYQAISQ